MRSFQGDVIDGGLGDDVIHGGDGYDNIKGGAGFNTIFGDAGEDIIDAGSGRTYVDGGADDDTIKWVYTGALGGQAPTLNGGADGNDGDTIQVEINLANLEAADSVRLERADSQSFGAYDARLSIITQTDSGPVTDLVLLQSVENVKADVGGAGDNLDIRDLLDTSVQTVDITLGQREATMFQIDRDSEGNHQVYPAGFEAFNGDASIRTGQYFYRYDLQPGGQYLFNGDGSPKLEVVDTAARSRAGAPNNSVQELAFAEGLDRVELYYGLHHVTLQNGRHEALVTEDASGEPEQHLWMAEGLAQTTLFYGEQSVTLLKTDTAASLQDKLRAAIDAGATVTGSGTQANPFKVKFHDAALDDGEFFVLAQEMTAADMQAAIASIEGVGTPGGDGNVTVTAGLRPSTWVVTFDEGADEDLASGDFKQLVERHSVQSYVGAVTARDDTRVFDRFYRLNDNQAEYLYTGTGQADLETVSTPAERVEHNSVQMLGLGAGDATGILWYGDQGVVAERITATDADGIAEALEVLQGRLQTLQGVGQITLSGGGAGTPWTFTGSLTDSGASAAALEAALEGAFSGISVTVTQAGGVLTFASNAFQLDMAADELEQGLLEAAGILEINISGLGTDTAPWEFSFKGATHNGASDDYRRLTFVSGGSGLDADAVYARGSVAGTPASGPGADRQQVTLAKEATSARFWYGSEFVDVALDGRSALVSFAGGVVAGNQWRISIDGGAAITYDVLSGDTMEDVVAGLAAQIGGSYQATAKANVLSINRADGAFFTVSGDTDGTTGGGSEIDVTYATGNLPRAATLEAALRGLDGIVDVAVSAGARPDSPLEVVLLQAATLAEVAITRAPATGEIWSATLQGAGAPVTVQVTATASDDAAEHRREARRRARRRGELRRQPPGREERGGRQVHAHHLFPELHPRGGLRPPHAAIRGDRAGSGAVVREQQQQRDADRVPRRRRLVHADLWRGQHVVYRRHREHGEHRCLARRARQPDRRRRESDRAGRAAPLAGRVHAGSAGRTAPLPAAVLQGGKRAGGQRHRRHEQRRAGPRGPGRQRVHRVLRHGERAARRHGGRGRHRGRARGVQRPARQQRHRHRVHQRTAPLADRPGAQGRRRLDHVPALLLRGACGGGYSRHGRGDAGQPRQRHPAPHRRRRQHRHRLHFALGRRQRRGAERAAAQRRRHRNRARAAARRGPRRSVRQRHQRRSVEGGVHRCDAGRRRRLRRAARRARQSRTGPPSSIRATPCAGRSTARTADQSFFLADWQQYADLAYNGERVEVSRGMSLAEVEAALESLNAIRDVAVTGQGTQANPWHVAILDAARTATASRSCCRCEATCRRCRALSTSRRA